MRYCHATPVLVDCEPAHAQPLIPPRSRPALPRAPRALSSCIFTVTRSISIQVLELARSRGLFVLEDAAEAHGAEYKGRRVGGFGDCAAFSFFGNKIITTGEGGMVTTNDDALGRATATPSGVKGWSQARRYWHPVIGYNYRMTNIAAAIGLAQMECADEALKTRWRIAGWYREHLAPLAGN